MDQFTQATARLANAQRKMKEAFEEVREATHEYLKLVEQKEHEQWREISKVADGKSRRPKGEIENLISSIFLKSHPGQLTFPEIYEAVRQMTITAPSGSTVRQTLYRMQKKNLLECYSGRWSRGINLRKEP